MSDPGASSRTAVLVVGPPRSGTSALSHVLSTLGVNFGDPAQFIDVDTHRHNPVFFELVELNRLNERILEALGWCYGDFSMLVREDDFDASFVDRFEPDVVDFLERHFGGQLLIGLKDPRFCFTLPLWRAVFERLGIGLRCALTLRDADAVAASNFRVNPRRGMPHARRIPLLSDAAARSFLRGQPYEAIRFEALAEAGIDATAAIARLTGTCPDAARAAITEVFDRRLVHWTGSESVAGDAVDAPADALAGDTGMLYRDLVEAARRLGWQADAAPTAAVHAAGPAGARLAFGGAEPQRRDGGTVQVFHRRVDMPYEESRSQTVPWPAHALEATFNVEFDMDVPADFLRIDVDDHPGAFVVRSLEADGVVIEPGQAVTDASGAVLPAGAGAGVAVLVNHDDPWLEFRVGREVRRVVVELVRMPLAQVSALLLDGQSMGRRLDAMHARLARLDDRVGASTRQLGERLGAGMHGLDVRMETSARALDKRFVDVAQAQARHAGLLTETRDALAGLDTRQQTWSEEMAACLTRYRDFLEQAQARVLAHQQELMLPLLAQQDERFSRLLAAQDEALDRLGRIQARQQRTWRDRMRGWLGRAEQEKLP